MDSVAAWPDSGWIHTSVDGSPVPLIVNVFVVMTFFVDGEVTTGVGGAVPSTVKVTLAVAVLP